MFGTTIGLLKTFADSCPMPTFFGLRPWYYYLNLDPSHGCRITNFDNGVLTHQDAVSTSPFLLIALAIVDDLVRIAALVAVGFVIYGGVQYITSQGSPDEASKAQATIVNALIGLVIALLATAIVSFLGAKLGG